MSIINLNGSLNSIELASSKAIIINNQPISYTPYQVAESDATMQLLVDKINEHKSMVISLTSTGQSLPEIIGSVIIPESAPVISAGQAWNPGTNSTYLNTIYLYSTASTLSESTVMQLPLKNTDPVMEGVKIDEFNYYKSYDQGLTFTFPDGSSVQLNSIVGTVNDTYLSVLEISEQKSGRVLEAYLNGADATQLLSTVQDNDTINLKLSVMNTTGYTGITTAVNAASLTYSNNVFTNLVNNPQVSGRLSVDSTFVDFKYAQSVAAIKAMLSPLPAGTEITVQVSHPVAGIWSGTFPIAYTGDISYMFGDTPLNTAFRVAFNSNQMTYDAFIAFQVFESTLAYDFTDTTVTVSVAQQTVQGGAVDLVYNGMSVISAYNRFPSFTGTEPYANVQIIMNLANDSNTVSVAEQLKNDYMLHGYTPPMAIQLSTDTAFEGGGSGGGTGGGGSGGGSGGGGSGGGGGGSTSPVSGAVVVGGKAVGTVSVDPRTTPVRVTISGVEQALPTGSVVRLSSTGQKFLKVSGGELAFTAISVTPPAEWSWSAGGSEAWSVLQSF